MGKYGYPKDLNSTFAILKRVNSSRKMGSNNNSQATAGVATVNASNKPLEQRDCYGYNMQENVVEYCPKIGDTKILKLSGWTYEK